MNQKPHVLILAGGLGTRLQSVVGDVPKPMAPIRQIPFLHYQLQYLKNQGFSQITLLTCHMADVIENYFKKNTLDLKINFIREQKPLGTGGAIAFAIENTSAQEFLILNGDSLFVTDLVAFLKQCKSPLTLALRHENDLSRYGGVEVDSHGKIQAFREKKSPVKEGLMNAGIYYAHRELLRSCPKGAFSLENDLFGSLIQKGLLFGVSCSGNFLDIGIPQAYEQAQELIPQWIGGLHAD